MAINLTDYSRTAAQRDWGAGWPSCNGAKAAGTAIVTADLSGTRMSVHKRIARLVDLLIDTTERRGYRLISGQCGGYNCRPIGGTNSPSNHSWGLAVDLNWQRNPMRRPLTTDIPAWMVALWNRYGFAWGGHYSGTPDPMHFEFMGTPADADAMTALAIQELTTPAAVTTTAKDWFDMATEADLRRVLAEALTPIARRDDVGHARNQILTAIGVNDPAGFPPSRKPEENEKYALARRADVGYAYEELKAAIAGVVAAGVDPDAVRDAITAALGGGLTITGTAVPATPPKG